MMESITHHRHFRVKSTKISRSGLYGKMRSAATMFKTMWLPAALKRTLTYSASRTLRREQAVVASTRAGRDHKFDHQGGMR